MPMGLLYGALNMNTGGMVTEGDVEAEVLGVPYY